MISPLSPSDFLSNALLLEKFIDVEELLKSITYQTIHVKQGQIVHYEKVRPMGIFFIKNGRVKISKTMTLSKEKMVGIYNNGKFIGAEEFCHNEPYRYTATAIEATELWFVSERSLAKETELWNCLRMLIKF